MGAWDLTVNAGNWEVVFGFLPAGVGLDGSGGPARDLALPEEGHHEGLLGAGAPAAHQADPARGQGAVCGRTRWLAHTQTDRRTEGQWGGSGAALTLLRLHVQADPQVAARVEEPVVGGRRDVEGQPALLPGRHRLHVQQHQLRLPDQNKSMTID